MPRVLITIGLLLVAIGLLWPWITKLGLGRLPGDIVIERGESSRPAPRRRAAKPNWQ